MVAEIILVPKDPKAMEGEKQAAQYVARALTSAGAKMREQVSLCAGRAELQKAIAAALGRSNVVTVLGGLSPEQQGISKAVVAQGLKLPLEEDPGLLESIRDYCRKTGDLFFPEDEALARVPRGAQVFPGKYGKTPGLAISSAKQHILLLPDNGTELASMLPGYVLPYLGGSEAETAVTRTLRTCGITEERVREALGELMDTANPAVTTQKDGAEVLVRVSAHAATSGQASALCTPALRAAVDRLGDFAYGLDVDSLQAAVIGKLQKKELDLAVAESGTGGILTRVLSETPGGADILRYSVAADSDSVKTKKLGVSQKVLTRGGSVSEQAAVAMAAAAREKAGTLLGLAITAGDQANKKSAPDAGALVYIAVCNAKNVYVKKLVVPQSRSGRDVVVDAALTRALNMLRLFVDYLPGAYKAAIPLRDALAGKTVTGGKAASGDDGPEDEKEEPLYKRLLGNFIIRKADEPSVKVRKFIFILAVLVFIGSAGYVGMYYFESFVSARQQQQLAGMYGVEEDGDFEPDDDYPADYLNAFAKLWSENPDVVGYLRIEGTKVEYPVVQAEDNDYYLRRDFYGSSNQHGIPFMDYRVDVKKPSDNMVIYGHNMKDGQMFGELMSYKEFDYYKEHPVIEFNTVYDPGQYKIISVFVTNAYTAQGPVFAYHSFVDAKTQEDFMNFVEQVQVRSRIITGVDVEPTDKLLTLSTCSYEFTEARTVVVARKVRPGEDPEVDVSQARVNPSPLYPDIWYQIFGGTKPNVDDATVVTQAMTNTPASSASAAASSTASASSGTPSQSGGQQWSSGTTEQPSSSSTVSSESAASQSSSESAASSSAAEQASESAGQSSQSSSESSREGTIFDGLDIDRADPDPSEDEDDYTGYLNIAAPGGRPASGGGALTYHRALSPLRDRMPVLLNEPSLFDGLDIEPPKGETYMDDDLAWGDTVIFGGGPSSSTPSSGGRTAVDQFTVTANGRKISGDAAEIVARIVQVEMGASFDDEALKAQAVAAYSYVLFHNQQGQSPNVILSSEAAVTAKVRTAVNNVIGEAVYYGNSVAFTPYHATSSGVTTSSAAVWGGSYSYLVSVDSSVDKNVSTFRMKKLYTSDQVSQLLWDKLGIETYGDPEDWFEILSYTDGPYIDGMRICGETHSLRTGNRLTGRNLRENVLGLRSHAFTIQYDRDADRFSFITSGYGHGVGMSQNGANQYARQGWSYKEILEHYYPGTKVR